MRSGVVFLVAGMLANKYGVLGCELHPFRCVCMHVL